ncbi:Mur ligase domain-containing protein [Paenibacillus sp. 2RAB27]|uniref:Mur ligase domain-containing protein n=1 Tax=Paenibacillus sp. 2RAB27 TaxID=3232991 RepID=UPI003F96DB56
MEVCGNSDIVISGIAYDSRKVRQGDIFVCIKGFSVDGHNFCASKRCNSSSGRARNKCPLRYYSSQGERH